MRISSFLSNFCFALLTIQSLLGQSFYFKSIVGDNAFIPYKTIGQANLTSLCTGTILGGNPQTQFLIQIDKDGNPQQSSEYVMNGGTTYSSLCKANDGNLITMASKLVNKISPSGNIIWSKKIEDNTLNQEIFALTDGYLLSTCVVPSNNTDCKTVLIKLNENGQQVWKTAIGNRVSVYSMVQDNEGFVYVCGNKSPINQNTSGMLAKIGTTGNILWSKTMMNVVSESLQKLILTPDNDLMIFGKTKSQNGFNVPWITKTDNNGEVKWSKTYESTDKDFEKICAIPSDGYIFAVNENLSGTVMNKINQNGELLWSYQYFSAANVETVMTDLGTVTDGILGVGFSMGSGPKQGFVLKTNHEGLIPDCCPKSYELTVKDVQVETENFIENIDVPIQWLDHVLTQQNIAPILTSLCVVPNLDFTVNKDTLCPGECVEINFSNPTIGFQYSWFFKNGTPNASTLLNPDSPICFEQEGSIILTATKEGCPKSASKKVTLQKPNEEFPNAFTPNNDGINDKFKPFILNCALRDYHLQIFNRWGEQVFDSTEFNEAWDGITPNGYEAPQDVYLWRVDYSETKDGAKVSVTKNGDVTVIR
jgi:gliding motility-associated-like protein